MWLLKLQEGAHGDLAKQHPLRGQAGGWMSLCIELLAVVHQSKMKTDDVLGELTSEL